MHMCIDVNFELEGALVFTGTTVIPEHNHSGAILFSQSSDSI